jgi:hypothetical protein
MAMAILAACAPAMQQTAASAGATSTALPDEFRAEVSDKRRLWRKQSVLSYRIQLEFIEDASRPTMTKRDVLVSNNTIRGARCVPSACPTSIFKDMMTVTDMFAFMLGTPESCVNQVRYDPNLYYPVYLSADCAEGIAHPFSFRVVTLYQLN